MKYEINMDTIVLDPNPVLRAKAETVKLPLSNEDKNTLLKMLQYVRDSKDEELAEKYKLQPAVGIAAPQIGVSKQMFAVSVEIDIDDDYYDLKEYALVNPRIIAHSEKQVALKTGEGCLSIRDVHEGLVPRYQRIRVKAYDMIQDKEITLQFTNYLAIVIQHEFDHLNGILFYDTIDKNTPWDPKDMKIIE